MFHRVHAKRLLNTILFENVNTYNEFIGRWKTQILKTTQNQGNRKNLLITRTITDENINFNIKKSHLTEKNEVQTPVIKFR